jgi:hypothetical protein
MQATRWAVRLGLALCLGVAAGCSKPPRPGVTYDVSLLTPGGGAAAPLGPPTRVASAVVQHVQELTHEGDTLVVMVRKTEYGRATFDVTFPDKAVQMVRVKVGETRDVLPPGQKIGVRLAVLECR